MGEGERRARSGGGGLPSEKAQGAREGGLSPSPQAEGADLLFWHRPREAVLGQGRRGPASLLPERATGRTQPWRQEPRRRPRGSPGGVPAEHAPPPPPPARPPPAPARPPAPRPRPLSSCPLFPLDRRGGGVDESRDPGGHTRVRIYRTWANFSTKRCSWGREATRRSPRRHTRAPPRSPVATSAGSCGLKTRACTGTLEPETSTVTEG